MLAIFYHKIIVILEKWGQPLMAHLLLILQNMKKLLGFHEYRSKLRTIFFGVWNCFSLNYFTLQCTALWCILTLFHPMKEPILLCLLNQQEISKLIKKHQSLVSLIYSPYFCCWKEISHNSFHYWMKIHRKTPLCIDKYGNSGQEG